MLKQSECLKTPWVQFLDGIEETTARILRTELTQIKVQNYGKPDRLKFDLGKSSRRMTRLLGTAVKSYDCGGEKPPFRMPLCWLCLEFFEV